MALMKTLKSQPQGQISDFLQEGKLSVIIKKAQQLSQWQTWLAELDSEVADHCRIANIRGTELIFEVDSAAWGMRLKFLASKLLKKFNMKAQHSQLKQIQYFIRPAELSQKPQYWSKKTLSPESVKIITEAALDTTDSALKDALSKLAKSG